MGLLAAFRRRPFLTAEERAQLDAALAGIDRYTQARIGFHVDYRSAEEPSARARALFGQWDLPQAERSRAVLIYACAATRRFAVVGGEEIRRVAPPAFWEQVERDLQHHFEEGRYCDGFFKALAQVATQLQHHFPPAGRQAAAEDAGLGEPTP